jgi:hypothetical protein
MSTHLDCVTAVSPFPPAALFRADVKMLRIVCVIQVQIFEGKVFTCWEKDREFQLGANRIIVNRISLLASAVRW